MDYGQVMDLVYLAAVFVPYFVGFMYRKRLVAWFARQIGPYVVQGVVNWAFITEDVEAEDGTKTSRRALSAPAKALLASVTPLLITEAMKAIKLKLPTGGGMPPNIDMGNIAQALPQMIMAMPGKNINLGGFKLPKEVAAALSSLAGGFFSGKGQSSNASATVSTNAGSGWK